jgi:hypothetical protein
MNHTKERLPKIKHVCNGNISKKKITPLFQHLFFQHCFKNSMHVCKVLGTFVRDLNFFQKTPRQSPIHLQKQSTNSKNPFKQQSPLQPIALEHLQATAVGENFSKP